MPKQELAQANPPPDQSQLPGDILKLKVDLDISNVLSDEELHALEKFTRAAEYIAACACSTVHSDVN
jgi:xylulose-5-phosphate/fructose-6-phosphate phosphoketolase